MIENIDDQSVYFYEPENPNLEPWELEIRSIRKFYLEKVTGWYMQDQNFEIIRMNEFDNQPGLWQVVEADQFDFTTICPTAKEIINFNESKIYQVTTSNESIK